ncbi:unnamed protein product [Ostreobium quekettii]|uniref:Uncharacterized protein n=1 Tax=Ostreobium quekettii TaxID=121088 RepID=A0A8S1JA53_9CHLO|nr:unnamed protein product [Ostreobium quekettii]|eukprot:evm.model.scf_812.3 EVM.evm.TU.scf_812.3   scf_812:16947-22959(+)
MAPGQEEAEAVENVLSIEAVGLNPVPGQPRQVQSIVSAATSTSGATLPTLPEELVPFEPDFFAPAADCWEGGPALEPSEAFDIELSSLLRGTGPRSSSPVSYSDHTDWNLPGQSPLADALPPRLQISDAPARTLQERSVESGHSSGVHSSQSMAGAAEYPAGVPAAQPVHSAGMQSAGGQQPHSYALQVADLNCSAPSQVQKSQHQSTHWPAVPLVSTANLGPVHAAQDFPFPPVGVPSPQQLALLEQRNMDSVQGTGRPEAMPIAFPGIAGAFSPQGLMGRFPPGYPPLPPFPGIPGLPPFGQLPPFSAQHQEQIHRSLMESFQHNPVGMVDPALMSFQNPYLLTPYLQHLRQMPDVIRHLPQGAPNQEGRPQLPRHGHEQPSNPAEQRPEDRQRPEQALEQQNPAPSVQGNNPLLPPPLLPPPPLPTALPFPGPPQRGAPSMQGMQMPREGQPQQAHPANACESYNMLRQMIGTTPSVPAGAGDSSSAGASVRITARVNLKVESELPPDMSSNIMRRLAAAFPEEFVTVDSSAREGCTNFIFDVVSAAVTVDTGGRRLSQGEGEPSTSDSGLAALPLGNRSSTELGSSRQEADDRNEHVLMQTVLERLSSLPGREYEFVRSAPVVVGVGKHRSALVGGQPCVPSQGFPEPCRPTIERVVPSCVLRNEAISVEVWGYHLLQPTAMFCRFKGRNWPLILQQAGQLKLEGTCEAPITFGRCQLPGLPSCGVGFMECELGRSLSGPQPVLVVDSVEVVREVHALLNSMNASEQHRLLTQLGLVLSHIDTLGDADAVSISSQSDEDSELSEVGSGETPFESDAESDDVSNPDYEDAPQLSTDHSVSRAGQCGETESAHALLAARDGEGPAESETSNSGRRSRELNHTTIREEREAQRTGRADIESGSPIAETADIPGVQHYHQTRLPEYKRMIAETARQYLSYFCRRGCTALARCVMPAAQIGCVTFSSVVAQSQSDGMTLLHQALLSGDVIMLRTVLDWGRDFQYEWEWTYAGPNGVTPLHCAAMNRNGLEALQLILEHKPEVCLSWFTKETVDGKTPSNFAEWSGFRQANELMMDKVEESYRKEGYPGHPGAPRNNESTRVAEPVPPTERAPANVVTIPGVVTAPRRVRQVVQRHAPSSRAVANDSMGSRDQGHLHGQDHKSDRSHWSIFSSSAVWMALFTLPMAATLVCRGTEDSGGDSYSWLLVSSMAVEAFQALWSLSHLVVVNPCMKGK